ncbi:nuclear transport factor 2 family protein [Kibdelosporangium philippinense]|uniref:Nuclear transport factor 2 family protein n=1 Tax=Kibdelosporangium philippinense TaxID=211113 RepID=A0ABS8Z3A1_9PSEU|nr:nuclear transport factor 2 family protein [Kibdelosporangium philippinense]MCE7002408.1 nuclear transport factor 2 family protein [Kibdelosporangium philippinense]
MTNATTERYRRAMLTGDVDLAMSNFAENAVLHSPLTRRVRFTGHAELRPLIEVAYKHLKDVDFHVDIGDEKTRLLVYRGKIRNEELEEAALLHLDDAGKITEATLFVRPLPGIVELMSAFGPDIARRNGRSGAARLLSVLTKPLLSMVKSGDKFAVPLAGPKR